jgi:hypothetical protein
MKKMTDAGFTELFAKAHAAGMAAGQAITPRPMYIEGYAPVADGLCGFAWITIRPANCAAAKYAKQHLGAGPHYGGGLDIWVHEFNQSHARKGAYAYAYAAVLQAAGINAVSGSRLD